MQTILWRYVAGALSAGFLLLAPTAGAADCPTGACPLAPPSAPRLLPQANAAAAGVDPRAIARIENALGSARSFGSGTLVDVTADQGLVVTCAHLFREGTGAIVVTFPSGARFGGRVAKLDVAADLAAVQIAAAPLEPVELAAAYPQRGDPLVSCGYGSDGRLWCNRGQALGYVSTVGGHGCETLELSGTARQGDSGGPVFDRNGQLAAVLFGTNGRVVDATYCGRVRAFLAGLSPRFASPSQAPPRQAERQPAPAEQQPAQSEPVAPPTPLPAAPPDQPPVVAADTPVPLQRIPRIVRPGRAARKNSPAEDAAGPDTPAQNSNPLDQAIDALDAAARPWLSAKVTSLLIAVGVPGGIAGVAGGAAVWLLMRRGKKRMRAEVEHLRARIESRVTAEPAPTTGSDSAGGIAQAAPAGMTSSENTSSEKTASVAATSATGASQKIVERHHNRYVPYEASSVDKAWAGAHARVSEKYPGAVPYLKIVEGVKDQLLSGSDEPQVS